MRREGKTETSLCEQWKHGEVDERIDSIQDAPVSGARAQRDWHSGDLTGSAFPIWDFAYGFLGLD